MWSNPTGQDWLINGNVALPGAYPGQRADGGNDVVEFDHLAFGNFLTGPATLDVPIDPLQSLLITNWLGTLTLNNGLIVTGSNGQFVLNDSSRIVLTGSNFLELSDLGGFNSWTNGTITGGDNSAFFVEGSFLQVGGLAGPLGTNLFINELQESNNPGTVEIIGMTDRGPGTTNNLTLIGTANAIYVGDGGSLKLDQRITANGRQNSLGGIAFGPVRTGTLAVEVDPGGLLYRGGLITDGVPDQVSIAGAVYNYGGTVDVTAGNMLNITGQDGNGRSYWQQNSGNGLLQLDFEANIKAAGRYQIDIGTVQFKTPNSGSTDQLDGAGLVFGNANPTSLKFAPGPTSGIVIVQGPVTLAQNTTTTMYFSAANNTQDFLDVQNGALTLNGTLSLQGDQMPTQPLYFFEDEGINPSITGNFTSITDNLGDRNDSGQVLSVQNADVYEVAFQR